MAVDLEVGKQQREEVFHWHPYHTVWIWLFLAWTCCYIDRSITGPVVAWMIGHDVAFLAGASLPYSLGGLVGSMFFAGYMLTQFPAGYLGDRYGQKVMIVLSTAGASVATFITGLMSSLYAFVAARVLTGLWEGAYYSNDRALIASVTPESKRGLAMGLIFTGLALGLTIATIATPMLLDAFASWWGAETAWSIPFILFSIPTAVVSVGVWRYVRVSTAGGAYHRAGGWLMLLSLGLLAIIMLTFHLTLEYRWGDLFQVVAVTIVALLLVAVIYRLLGDRSSMVLRDRSLVLMYLSAIPILYTLWFFGFWALAVVAESSHLGIAGAALYAAFFGIANGLGYPLGGKLWDLEKKKGHGGKRCYVALCLLVTMLVLSLGAYLSTGGSDYLVIAVLIFSIGVPFAAMQTVHMTMVSDLAPPGMLGQAYGMWNLVAEIGALLSPVVSGVLRDLTGGWTLAIMVNGALLLISLVLVLGVRTVQNG
jgi:MFS transporter, ACS family, D-galactonate transporter